MAPVTSEDQLPPRDRKALEFIRAYTAREGRGPSIREIGEAVGIDPPNNAVRILNRLKASGFIGDKSNTQVGRPRTLGPADNVAAGDFTLTILGRVPAGAPKVYLDAEPQQFDFAREFGGKDRFMLQVEGESMIEDGIMPGDLVIVRSSPEAEVGEQVICEIDGQATLKVYHESGRRGQTQRWLMPRNKGMNPISLDQFAGSVRIVGVLVGVIRRAKKSRRLPSPQ